MVKPDRDYAQEEILSRLQFLMFLRVGLVSLLLGVAIIIQVRETKTYFGEILNAHYFLIVLIYFLTFFYAIVLRRVKELSRFAYLQILIDTIFITSIIYTTGGIESFFSFLYLLNIISGGIILYRRGGMITASFSSILYGAILDLSYYGLIAPMGQRLDYLQAYPSGEIFYRILANVAAFYLVAFLSSFLSEQTRKSKAELKAKQEDLADLEMLKENIIQSISSGLIALDENGKIAVFNKGAEDIFNINSTGATFRHINDVVPLMEPYLRANHPNKFSQLSYVRNDDKKIDLILNISPLREPDGNKKGDILVFQDITHIREMEREVKRMEDLAVIGELAAGIAHEIRNPLASISGSIQVLNDSLSKEGTHINKRLMEIVLREIDRLNNLVNDFLLFARPRRIEIESVDLNQLIIDTLDIFKNSQDWPQMDVETKFFGPSKINSDPQQLKQVFWNIFLNACEAIPVGGFIRVSTEKSGRYNEKGEFVDQVIIKVQDNGPGIDPQVIDDIFKPFSTAKKDGSGLGLAIVKRIIEGFGGEISCRNLEDGGAAIAIILPLNVEPA